MLSNLSINLKLTIIVLVGVFGLLTTGAFLLLSERQAIREAHEHEIMVVSEIAVGVLAQFHAAHERGEITLEQAQAQARDMLRSFRFGSNDYIYAYDYEGTTMVLGPAPEREGESMIDVVDPNGVPVVRNLIDVARNGGGTLVHEWPRAGSETPEPKIGYAAPFPPWEWLVGTGVYVGDLDAAFYSKAVQAAWIMTLALLITAGVAFAVARSLSRGIAAITATMSRLAQGESGVTIPFLTLRSELGQMAQAVEVFAMAKAEVADLHRDRLMAQHVAASERRAALLDLAEVLDSRVKSVMGGIATAAADNKASADAIAIASTGTADRAKAVGDTTRSVSRRIETVASATQDLTASIHVITQQVADSTAASREAAAVSDQSTSRMADLTAKTEHVSGIVEMITAIAKQTNLLALNATIEAARAGEAGRGFAIVATEVKALADQSGKAAEDIADQIVGVQDLTRDTADAIQRMGTVINRLAGTAETISTAIQRQSDATDEIAENLDLTARDAGQVAESMTEVLAAARESETRATAVADVSEVLSGNAEQMGTEIDHFLKKMRGEDTELLSWNEQLSVRHGTIDREHKRLIELINQLNEAMIMGKGRDMISQVLDELIDYTQNHFAREEGLMRQHAYPFEAEHRQMHKDLVSEVNLLKKRFDAGESVVSQEVMSFLKDWLTNHILNVDKKLGDFLNSRPS